MAIEDYSMIWQPNVQQALEVARRDMGEQSIFPKKVAIQAYASFGRTGVYETDVTYEREGKDIYEKSTVMISVGVLKDLGIVTRINSLSKAERWLEGHEGSKWLGYFMMMKEQERENELEMRKVKWTEERTMGK